MDENLAFTASAYRVAAPGARARARAFLESTGLDRFRDRLAGDLSGGMRQKLGVIRALLHRPGLVVLDEPTTGVDPVSRARADAMTAMTTPLAHTRGVTRRFGDFVAVDSVDLDIQPGEVHQPDLLVLDEPTSGVDPLARARLWETVRSGSSGPPRRRNGPRPCSASS